jgi:hypothetical protein
MRGVEEGVVVRQLEQLLVRRVGDRLAAIADVDAPQAGEGVEQLLAFGIPEIGALCPGDDPAAALVQVGVIGEGMDVAAIQRLPLGGRIALRKSGHDVPRIDSNGMNRRSGYPRAGLKSLNA